jgi:3-oxoacyl-[acyl-carrier protein] reductase
MNFLITGGSRGIGESIVREALKQEHNVAFTYHTQGDKAIKLLIEYSNTFPKQICKAYKLDVSLARKVEHVGNKILDDFNKIDVVVANAGINISNLLVSMTDEEWHSVIETNLTGTFFVCRHFLQHMIINRFGRIIMVSSVGSRGSSGQAAYSASKAGLYGLSGTIAKEYGKKGITSNIVSPGFFETDMTQNSATNIKEFWNKFSPVQRTGKLEELSKLILFLSSPQASFINGAHISVHGGLDWLP